MNEEKKWADRIVGNPVYVLSALVMMYAINVLLGSQSTTGNLRHVLLTYGSLQLYECAVLALAVWITFRLVVPDDAATLLIIESLLLGAAFITLDELLAGDTGWGYILYAIGLVLAAGKLALGRHPLGLAVGWALPVFVWLSLVLPAVWAPQMKVVATVEPLAVWTAELAWWSLGGLILLGVVTVWLGSTHATGQRSLLPPAILAAAAIIAAGGHLFALHHSFLAPPQVSYVAPAYVAAAFAVVLTAFVKDPRLTRWKFAWSWLPCLGIVLVLIEHPNAPPLGRGPAPAELALVGAEVFAVYGCLAIMTRKKCFALHVFALVVFAFADQWRMIAAHLTAHRGWWLLGLAFGLLAAGATLTLHKHRRRVLGIQDQATAASA